MQAKKVAKWKVEEVEKLSKMISEYPVVGIVNMENIPAKQLQKMREVLRGEVVIRMSRKRLMKLALEKAKVKKLAEYLKGQPAFVFSKMNPFKLYKILEKNKTSAPAKPNAIAPKDIIVPKGETPFSPGPVLAELQKFGIPTAIQKNKIIIKEDKLVVKEGERISPELASLLTRVGIEPMEIGLNLLAVYEGGVIYSPDVLAIDENMLIAQLKEAYLNAVNLSVNTGYITKETAPLLIAKAYSEAKAVAIEAGVYEPEVIKDIIAKAHLQMLALKSTINWR
ncbi:MAG: 50S ribosomal protein L10 [Candidatus Hydrothermarchaeota archaeon]|nr:MAG: 50S ribosomal protein L10 [Candidatus Hydrothermarchaeota archaeon]